jgi:hypothetical protein
MGQPDCSAEHHWVERIESMMVVAGKIMLGRFIMIGFNPPKLTIISFLE